MTHLVSLCISLQAFHPWVDTQGHTDVEAAEYDERFPSKTVKHDGNDEGIGATADGPSQDGERVSLRANLLGPDLGRIDPAWHNIELDKDEQEDEHEGC